MLAAGLPYQEAHRVVGQVVAIAIERGVPAERISVALLDEAAQAAVGRTLSLAPEALAEALDPRAIVATRTGLGGAAREPMRAMIAECRQELAEMCAWRDETERRLLGAEADLVGLARNLAAPSQERG
jgi:argininosuccinate lyase